MGWSCRADAGNVLDKMSAACVASTGMSNTWEHNGVRYFFEISRTEHADGAITGSVCKFVGKDLCRKSGSIRIEGDGTITRAPAFLKNAAKAAVKAAA